MALAILDGTQTATTLSTILSSGQHITAHTVVSLGTQAKTDILSAVSSGIAISGTVTANVTDSAFTTQGKIASFTGGTAPSYGVLIGFEDDEGNFQTVNNSGRTLPVNGDVSILGFDTVTGYPIPIQVTSSGSVFASLNSALPAGTNRIGVVTIGAGTVTIGAGTAHIGSVTASISGTVTVGSGVVTVSNIQTVTAGSLLINTTKYPTALVGYDGTNATWQAVPLSDDEGYARGVIVGNSSGVFRQDNPLPISGTVTVGNTVTIAGTVTIGAGTAQIGSVTASLAISSTAITSGSFASLTSATLVPGNVARKMATVFNQGAGQLFVNAGATATTLGGGFMVALSSGDYYECGFTTTTLSAIYATAGTCSWVSH